MGFTCLTSQIERGLTLSWTSMKRNSRAWHTIRPGIFWWRVSVTGWWVQWPISHQIPLAVTWFGFEMKEIRNPQKKKRKCISPLSESGGRDCYIRVWNTNTFLLVHLFRGNSAVRLRQSALLRLTTTTFASLFAFLSLSTESVTRGPGDHGATRPSTANDDTLVPFPLSSFSFW